VDKKRKHYLTFLTSTALSVYRKQLLSFEAQASFP